MIRLDQIPVAYKLAFTVNLLIALAFVFLFTSTLKEQQTLLENQFEAWGTTTAAQLSESAMEPLFTADALTLASLTRVTEGLTDVLGTEIFDQKGQTLASAGLTAPEQLLGSYFLDGSPDQNNQFVWPASELTSRPEGLVSFVAPIQFKGVVGGYALVTFSRDSITQAISKAYRGVISLGITLGCLVMSAILWICRHFAQPIQEMVKATEAIAAENYSVRIHKQHHGEFGTLINSFNNMAKQLELKLQVESVFSRFVSDPVANTFMGDLDKVQLGGKRVSASVVFVDIVGFTAMSERLPPEKISEILNETFSHCSYACNCYNGIVDKFIGDGAMLVFGAPHHDANHEYHAVACAVLIKNILQKLNKEKVASGQEAIEVRIGISSGVMLAGILGAKDRMQYTVIGDNVNLASRLCSLAEPGQIVVDEAFFNRANRHGLVLGHSYKPVEVKGKSEKIHTYIVSGLESTALKTIHSTSQMLVKKSLNQN